MVPAQRLASAIMILKLNDQEGDVLPILIMMISKDSQTLDLADLHINLGYGSLFGHDRDGHHGQWPNPIL